VYGKGKASVLTSKILHSYSFATSKATASWCDIFNCSFLLWTRKAPMQTRPSSWV